MHFLGIDPGVSGGIAVLEPNKREIELYDTPTVAIKSGKTVKNMMDCYTLVTLLHTITGGRDVLVTIEKVQAMPGGGERTMGATSAFNFGMGFGMWLGILAALRLPFQQVHPATWKKLMMAGHAKDKDADRLRAMQLYPEAASRMNLKKHHGRADALLLAGWAYRTHREVPMQAAEQCPEPF